ncbi:unnamed protein product [Prorocentrum cordatum]|uniref:RING-type domain-containing protein n=1 Tax=Prorocentrum cordatum TaxID=2364126 RepID=A0ABN9VLD8_9DINO|nr:unnamed protein product [Polarella glacialis]
MLMVASSDASAERTSTIRGLAETLVATASSSSCPCDGAGGGICTATARGGAGCRSSSRPGQVHPWTEEPSSMDLLRTRNRCRTSELENTGAAATAAAASAPRIGMTNVERRQDPFDQRRDRCPESSFRSYLDGECWICTAAGEASQWDMWVSCRHMFCSGCSSEMMQRRMPCPLCRQWSSTVVRGPRCLPAAAGHAAPVAQAAEAPASGSRALRTAETFTMGE